MLAPLLSVPAVVPVPAELAPPLAVSAVPVPPEFGVETGGSEFDGPALAGLPVPVEGFPLVSEPVFAPVEVLCAAMVALQAITVSPTLLVPIKALNGGAESAGTLLYGEDGWCARKAVQRPNWALVFAMPLAPALPEEVELLP